MTLKQEWAMALMSLFLLAGGGERSPLENITITTVDGETVAIQADDPPGIKTRPLRKLKERWDRQVGREFLFFKRIEVKAGLEIEGKYEVQEGPLRLTVYQISKKQGEPRFLRVLSSRFHEARNVAEVVTRVEELEENAFFITAEKVESASQLNPHLQYMAFRNNEVEVRSFATNWNLSELKFKMMGELQPARDVGFVKDADWLIGQLIDPQWIVVIRVEAK